MEIGSKAVEKALSLGATEAEAYIKRSTIIQASFSDEIDDLKTTTSTGMGLRIVIGKRTAMYSTSILREGEVSDAAQRAVDIARVAPEDSDWKHLNRSYGKSPVKGAFDEDTSRIEYTEIIEDIRAAIDAANSYDPRVRPTRGMLQIGTTTTSIVNSYGDPIEARGTAASAYILVKAEDDGLEISGTETREVRAWSDMNLESIAEGASEKAIGYLKAKPITGGKMPVILDGKISARILGVMLSSPINADLVQKGGSPLADKMGDQIAAEDITIIDDGTLPKGLNTGPFDAEGHPTQRTPVVEDGVLKSFLYDSYTALKDSVKSTGNAGRSGYSSPPSPSPTNLILAEGDVSPEEMIQETGRGLYVERVIGEWLSNPISGNLNATVTHGYLVEGGELKTPVKGVILGGNFYHLLKEGYELIGNDTMNSNNLYSPTVKLRTLTVAGK
ncbi:MAG: TldD/PmbA family protein [Candidatus Bathyarchaeia archaeon]